VNRWLIVGLIVLAILIIAGIAYDQGAFDNMEFGRLATFFAVLAAPYMLVKNMLFAHKDLKSFQTKYSQLKTTEVAHRTEMDQSIKAKEQRIYQLDKEIQLLDAKMEVLELKKKKVEQDVNSMSVSDTKKEVRNLFGD
jgi:hypothetical protein